MTILQPYSSPDGSKWFAGTAHAIYQNIDYIDSINPKYLLVLSGDHIYKMDYSDMLQQHIDNGASLTVAVIDVPWEDASRFGIMNTDEHDRITEFVEKPAEPKSNHASMGIYIFNWARLREVLVNNFTKNDNMLDFGKNVIPYYLDSGERSTPTASRATGGMLGRSCRFGRLTWNFWNQTTALTCRIAAGGSIPAVHWRHRRC